MNILLIEDNEADQRVIKEAFAAHCTDGTLHIADDGEQALAMIGRRNGYAELPAMDLILLDLNLPGTHGHDILKVLKADKATRNIPVIVLTSSTFQGDICRSYELHASCYINKPMRYSELLNLVKLVCDFWVKQVRYCYS